MSCHDIGRGMDSVTQVVIRMYDAGEINSKTALKLFTALKKGVHWCDGNEYEAVLSIFNCRCGNCLKKMKLGEKFFNIYDAPSGVTENSYDILRNYKEDHAGWRFCTECFDKIINTVSNGNYSGEDARKYIEQIHEDRPEVFTVVDE
jgi:hypothetical protein